MTSCSSRIASSLLLSLLLVPACGGGTSDPDAGRSDAPVAPLDAPTLDAPIADDASPGIDAPVTETDAGTTDAGTDAPVTEPDAGGCAYTALDEVIVECDDAPTFVSHIGVFPPSDDCPPYWVVGSRPTHYDTAEQAIAGEACDAGCQWHFAMSVTRLYCGRRTGYEVLRAEEAGCDDLYRFDDGYYPSVEAYDETHPCAD